MNVLTYVHLRNIYRSTGAGRVARNLTEALSRRPGIAVRVLADRGDHAKLPADIGEPWSTFPYVLFDHDTSVQHARWLVLRRPAARDYWPEADLVFSTAESFVPKGGARLAVTAHDAAYFERDIHRSALATWKQRWKWRRLYGVLTAEADVIHTVSQFSADRLGHFFPGLRSRIRVVHNGVTAPFFEPPSPAARPFLTRHGLDGRRYVHLPGGLSYRKNAELILRTWPAISRHDPDLLLAISGHVDGEYRSAHERLGPSVRWLGFTTDEELKWTYREAQLTWFPSRYEGFGIPLLESMACGSPIVSTNVSAIPEVAGRHAILLPVDDVGAHCDAVIGLLGDARQRETMRRAGVIHAARFTWPEAGRRLADLFQSVL